MRFYHLKMKLAIHENFVLYELVYAKSSKNMERSISRFIMKSAAVY